jgi:hypothetical protein
VRDPLGVHVCVVPDVAAWDPERTETVTVTMRPATVAVWVAVDVMLLSNALVTDREV